MPAAAGHGRLEATHADREHAIDTLKAAFVQGRLTKDELDERLGQTLASRTRTGLAMVTADIPAGLTAVHAPPGPARWPLNMGVKWGGRIVLVTFMFAALMVAGALNGPGPDTQACRAFHAWTRPAAQSISLLDVAVADARRGPNSNLREDLQALRQLVRQFGGSARPWPAGSVQESGQSRVDNASVLVSADCMAYG